MALFSLDAIKDANRRNGGKWFSSDTMRWWSSRVSSRVYSVPNGAVFVSSERDTSGGAWNGQRRYTVRHCTDGGDINGLSEYGEFTSLSGAHRAAQRYQAKLRIEQAS